MIPTIVFHIIVSCRIRTASTGAIAGLMKKAIEPVVASESLIEMKYVRYPIPVIAIPT